MMMIWENMWCIKCHWRQIQVSLGAVPSGPRGLDQLGGTGFGSWHLNEQTAHSLQRSNFKLAIQILISDSSSNVMDVIDHEIELNNKKSCKLAKQLHSLTQEHIYSWFRITINKKKENSFMLGHWPSWL
ncbi:hypothetical protein VP01_869g8 [Puccinia sorghi]|uniref:Uncharacterized protein n=1 Tax=Puccinia sorghi TaxID=27349 RepID=A0A0L6U9H0_9BASI|nr:hypothetical protein VP01_869g8 [Puccinia sorghi]